MTSRGVPLPSMFLYYQWDTGSFVWGGGGGFVRILCLFYVLFFAVLFFTVLVLVVYSIVSCSHMSCVLFLVLHAVVGSV